MAAKAYVLIQVETGKAAAVVEILRQKPGVITADLVIGPYDIIIVAEASDVNSIAKLVMNGIHGITGVTRTLTCMVAEET